MVKIALIDDESAVLESIRRCVENEITLEDEAVLSVYTLSLIHISEPTRPY